jgi:putative Flp pilus-assembly TadE/G-like protein
MNQTNEQKSAGRSRLRCVSSHERGQILPMALLSMFTLFGFCGFVIDSGRMYLNYQQLQASTDAAAMAGGQGLPSSTTAIANANAYSSLTGDNNVFSSLKSVAMVSGYPAVKCIVYTALPIPCAGASGTYNAIQVKQQATVPMTFAKFFGASSVTLTATATASSTGSLSIPYNIALIIDTTSSMGGGGSDSCTDPISGARGTTSIACALIGAKILMLNTAPCAGGVTTCPGTNSGSVDMISLFTFPNGEASTMKNDYTSPCSGPTVNVAAGYSYPVFGQAYAPSLTSTTQDYQVTSSYLADYRVNDATNSLNTSSNLVRAIGQVSGCAGLQTPGGLNTYYAGALVAAQDTLVTQAAASGRTGSQNAIILLTDGQANSGHMATTDVNGNPVSATASTYPSQINQCQQAMNAASTISAAGTTIYVVAYGSPNTTSNSSNGCTTDTSGTHRYIAPCAALKAIATSLSTFYADDPTGSNSGCTSAQNPETGLANIFGAIAGAFTKARLIPASVFAQGTA